MISFADAITLPFFTFSLRRRCHSRYASPLIFIDAIFTLISPPRYLRC
jgi:hypothetical protein